MYLNKELFCLFPTIQFPALSSLEVNNLIPQLTWFGRPPKDMQLAVTAVMERLTWALPLHQLKALHFDCILFSSSLREIPTLVSLNFFKELTSLTSLLLYSPSISDVQGLAQAQKPGQARPSQALQSQALALGL
ncbi:uncharacterized protein ARMOST_15210 [Armillaria ostoyae]|uniref:Uncharacterized protein n=1 Tax=Armillaria ostoyae TaxID=47428 RepID=A0A284RST6_ARMOS|nr:uncharacterized protein ARMOST_15210 [Armillaria ostoyae]